MKQMIALTLILGLAASPALTQEELTPDTGEGFSLMEEGARLLMRGLMTEMEPAIDDLRDSMEEAGPAFAELAGTIGPAFSELLRTVDDLRNYEAPEILPNGDIIMRRSPDAPAWEPDPESGDIEL